MNIDLNKRFAALTAELNTITAELAGADQQLRKYSEFERLEELRALMRKHHDVFWRLENAHWGLRRAMPACLVPPPEKYEHDEGMPHTIEVVYANLDLEGRLAELAGRHDGAGFGIEEKTIAIAKVVEEFGFETREDAEGFARECESIEGVEGVWHWEPARDEGREQSVRLWSRAD